MGEHRFHLVGTTEGRQFYRVGRWRIGCFLRSG